MVDPEFGEEVRGPNGEIHRRAILPGEPIYEMARVAPALKSVDTTLLLRDRYETIYGIYNHDLGAVDRPMISVAMHSAEDVSTGSLLDERIAMFAEKQVGKWFNISLTEFLDYPPDIVLKILEISTKQQNTEGSVTANVLNQLNQQGANKP